MEAGRQAPASAILHRGYTVAICTLGLLMFLGAVTMYSTLTSPTIDDDSRWALTFVMRLEIFVGVVASLVFGLLGISFGGWFGYLIAGVIGACILIAIGRAVGRRT